MSVKTSREKSSKYRSSSSGRPGAYLMFRLKGRWGGGGDGALIGGKALHRGALSSAIEQELKKKMKNKQYSWKKKTLEAHGDKKANGKIIIKKKLKRRRTYPPLLILP